MKFSQLINTPLRLFGLKLAKLSTLKKMQDHPASPCNDIEGDTAFMQVYNRVKDFTMVGIERCYALYTAVNYITRANIPGGFAECGVWKGGSCMLVAHSLLAAGVDDRDIYLYDSFDGMPEPGLMDGSEEKKIWATRNGNVSGSDWCLSSIEEVRKNMISTGYPEERIKLVHGKVEETLPGQSPPGLALLRLDTDWYQSTLHELTHLYPILVKKGILIIDDYGVWSGARKAVDEYFNEAQPIILHRIDGSGRLIVKP